MTCRPTTCSESTGTRRGLVPAIVQDVATPRAMLGYTEPRSTAGTEDTRRVLLQPLAARGCGRKAKLGPRAGTVRHSLDCDGDTLLYS